MKRFQVWIRPIEDFCRIRVHGYANARWLCDRLGSAFVFRTFEPMEEESSACWSFRIPYNPPLSRSRFRHLLQSIPEVELMPDAA